MRARILAGLGAVALLALSGCGPFPDARQRMIAPRPTAPAQPLPGRPADEAESACLDAGRAAGFEVQRLLGTREVMGTEGLATSRDVMLSIRRGGRDVEVRCSYSYATSTARIMTL